MTIEQARSIDKLHREAYEAIAVLNDELYEADYSDGGAITDAMQALLGIDGVQRARGYLECHKAMSKETTP